jgi:ComF family protein
LRLLAEIKDSLLHLAFPHVCEGCGSSLPTTDNLLCVRCLAALPETRFHLHDNNPIEKIFWGRLQVTHATAQYYFTKESLMQHLMHQLKYTGNKPIGHFLGRLMGNALIESKRFHDIDALVPLPLFPSKEFKRGYNQATILCEGIAEVFDKPILKNAIIRTTHTESQTKKGRVERWQNMEGRFELRDEVSVRGKHLLLIDDVITTGATLEACGSELLESAAELSIATLCFSSH